MKQILYFILVSCISCDFLYFRRNLTCVQSSQSIKIPCSKWNQSTSLHYYMTYFQLCFPQRTLLQTSQGSKFIEDLEIGDSVLSYNRKINQSQYSPVIAWISRDVDAVSTFASIRTQGNVRYAMSPLHNIAVHNQQKEIQYKFANSTSPETMLVALNGGSSKIIQVKTSQQMNGLYAPLTMNSNFYIYPYGTDHEQANKSNLILVHCYSQIHNPESNQKFITPILYASSFILDYNQPNFINPFYYNMKYLLGNSWVNQDKVIKLDLNQFSIKQSNLRIQSYSLSKGSSGGGSKGSSSRGGGTHYYSSSTTANHHNARKKRITKLFSLMSIMKNSIFNV